MGTESSRGLGRRPFPYQKYFGEIPVLANLLRDGEKPVWLANVPQDPPHKEIVLYLGCNVLRTVHIAETVVDVLTHIKEDFVALGGPAICCGIIHHNNGDVKEASRISLSTVGKFEVFKPSRIVTWCPSCTHHLDFLEKNGTPLPAPVQHISEYLVENLYKLNFLVPLGKRVALHAHTGTTQQEREAEATRKILSVLPGVELVDVYALEELGRHCVSIVIDKLSRPKWEDIVQGFLREATVKGVDTVATVYHSCQREMCHEERDFPVNIENYITLVARALGLREHEDKYKRFKLVADPKTIMGELSARIGECEYSVEKANEAIRSHFAANRNPS